MASKGMRAISCQGTRKVVAGYNPSHTSETLIGYVVCCAFVHFFFHCYPIPRIPVNIIIHKIVFGIPCIIKDVHVFLVL
jgi:hypothetical protein